MCMENDRMSKTRFLMDIVAIFAKVIKSIGFNTIIFVVGYILGFGTLHVITHMSWLGNQNYECVRDLQKHLEQQRELDKKIDREIIELKLRLVEGHR